VVIAAAAARGAVFTTFLIIVAETYLRGTGVGTFWPWWLACVTYTIATSVPAIVVRLDARVSTLIACADVILITILLYLTGGTDSPYFALYILPVLQAAVRLRLRDGLAAALLSVVSYSMLGFTGSAAHTVAPVWYLQVAALAGLAAFVALLCGLLVREMQERECLCRQLELVHQVSAEAQSTLMIDDLLTTTVQSMLHHFGYSAVRILVAPAHGDGSTLRLVANAGAKPLRSAGVESARQRALSSQTAISVHGAEGRPDFTCVPLQAGNRPAGILEVEGRGAAEHGAILVPETLARVLSTALNNAFLYRGTFLGAVSALTAAIDAKHTYTRGHSDRVTRHALFIADQLGLEQGQREDIRLAGLLHDVGKIGSPEFILDKSGPLTESEWETIQQHPQRGADLVANIPGMEEVARIIRHHHERHDGTGYPDGLAGEDIPLGARILAVADAFDAMTSARAYKPPLPESVARGELRRCAKAQFDPDLVEHACRWTRGEERPERPPEESRAMPDLGAVLSYT
jgi:putative nucleotidyltransferase with HDIG domain